jgi:oligosaccharide repeat unit polymerase
LFRRRLAFVFIALIVAGLALFLIVDVLRQSKDGQVSELSPDLQRLLKYSFGSLAAFSTWFHEYQKNQLTFGAYTFGGIFDSLGLQHREIGLYGAFVTLPGGEETNIYTVVRGVIEDFSLPGSVVLAFVLGLISGIVLSRPRRQLWLSILFGSAYYAFVLCSPLTSIFTYNGLVLAWLVAAAILRLYYKRKLPSFLRDLDYGPSEPAALI